MLIKNDELSDYYNSRCGFEKASILHKLVEVGSLRSVFPNVMNDGDCAQHYLLIGAGRGDSFPKFSQSHKSSEEPIEFHGSVKGLIVR
jgi:hypothetical protein